MVGAFLLAGTAVAMALTLTPTPAFLALWLPTGVVCGAGIGMISTGVSSAAALASAEKFASSTGLNLTARRVGGAVGIAALAAMLTSPAGPVLGDYRAAYWLCSVAALLAALAGMTMAGRRRGVLEP